VVSGEIFYDWGDFYTGTRSIFSVDLVVKAGAHFSCSADYTRNAIRLAGGAFNTHDLGGRVTYAFSTRLNVSLFGQWNNEDQTATWNFRVHWIPEIGSDVYLVYNHDFGTADRFLTSRTVLLAKVAYRFAL
jgi:hypothetical protein